MNELYRSAMRWMNTMDQQDWLILAASCVALGFFLLRGMGSRSSY